MERFTAWVASQGQKSLSILFTPWGEALGHRYYKQALVELSRLPQVRRVSIQTNLSAPVKDLQEACKETLALWTTFHPGEVPMSRFLSKCSALHVMGLRFSVGIVGLKEHLDHMEQLRRELPAQVYLWVNAYKREPHYYQPADLDRIRRVDPHFDHNNTRYPSLARPCAAGQTHFTVDGLGEVRSCHFVSQIMGNIYRDDMAQILSPRLCPVETCGCYIGYIHRPELEQEKLYGHDLLARIPAGWG